MCCIFLCLSTIMDASLAFSRACRSIASGTCAIQLASLRHLARSHFHNGGNLSPFHTNWRCTNNQRFWIHRRTSSEHRQPSSPVMNMIVLGDLGGILKKISPSIASLGIEKHYRQAFIIASPTIATLLLQFANVS